MKSLHQFVPTWEPGAIGRHVLGVHQSLVDAGVDAVVWADDIKAGLPPIARPTSEFFGGPATRADAVLLYHTAMGSPLGDQLLARPEPLVLDHHNLTPPDFFDPWEPALAENLAGGRAQVDALARRAVLGIGDSAFNASELAAAGCARTAVVPVFMQLGVAADPARVAALRGSTTGARWLFVGRVVPNKAIHDLVAAFAAYRHGFDPDARLHVVGAPGSAGYSAALMRLVDRLEVAEHCEFTGAVSDDDLAAHYRAADVFVCVSDHEGFCVPVVEAMAARLPVVAFDTTAVGETIADGGMLLARKSPTLVAAALHRVVHDATLREHLLDRGAARAAQFSPTATSAALLDALLPVLQGH